MGSQKVKPMFKDLTKCIKEKWIRMKIDERILIDEYFLRGIYTALYHTSPKNGSMTKELSLFLFDLVKISL